MPAAGLALIVTVPLIVPAVAGLDGFTCPSTCGPNRAQHSAMTNGAMIRNRDIDRRPSLKLRNVHVTAAPHDTARPDFLSLLVAGPSIILIDKNRTHSTVDRVTKALLSASPCT